MEYVLGLATLLGGLSAAWYFWEKFTSRKHTTNDQLSPDPVPLTEDGSADEQVRKLIENYHHLSIVEIIQPGILRFDLTAAGLDTEFAALYRTEKHTILDVFTTREKGLENLFHRIRIDEELMPAFIVIDERPYFICATRSGSGGFFDLSLYSYDGIGKLSEVFKVGSLFQGHFWVSDSRLFISGDNKRFEVRKEDGSLILVPYEKKPQPQGSPGTHVLSIALSGDDLIIKYDDTPIAFESGEMAHRSTVPIRVQMEELIVVDDNLVEAGPQSIRVLFDGTAFDGHRHFFYSIQPTRRTRSDIKVSYNYGDWYTIDVIIE